MNRGTLRSDVLDYMDAVGNDKWDVSQGGNVDRRISSVYDAIWRDILNSNPYYRVGKRTTTSDGSGRYSIAALTIGGGDDLQRFYRVLGVVIDGYTYDGPVQFAQWAPSELANPDASPRVWYQEGLNLVALPTQALKMADAIWVNYIPQRPDSYEGDGSVVDFPDGHEEVLIGYSAARLLTKGGAETQAAAEIKAELLPEYKAMLADVARVSVKPTEIQYGDLSCDWGV